MNMGDSGLNPVLGRMDDEDCFGFHSEYYIDPEWRKKRKDDQKNGYEHLMKGYTFYSKYRDDIYFIPLHGSDGCIIKSNVKQKTARAIKLDTKRVFERSNDFLAVNRRGYFIYNAKMVTLFGFDGREIYTHKLGKKDSVECVYIYDDKVIYSETKTAKSTQIYCVNMLTQEKTLLWGTEKGDFEFDEHLRDSYRQEWGTELPFSQAPSSIGVISCRFLYANNRRVIAGYTREEYAKGCQISYIIHVDYIKNQVNA